jgi:hypothetical protein
MYVPNQDLDFHPHMLWYFFCLMWVKMREWFFVDIVELFTISLNFLFIIMMIFDMIEILSHIFGIQMYIICLSDYESNLKRWCMHNETCRRRILNKPEFCITQLKVPMLEIFVNYTSAPPEGGILFYLCPSFHPSKIFFVAFFSATIDGRNLIFGHKLHIGMPYCGKRFWTLQIPTSCLPT